MSDNCDHNFGTFDDFGVKNDQKVSNNMILMSKYKGKHGGKKGQKIRAWVDPPPTFGQCPKENVFFSLMSSLTSQKLSMQFQYFRAEVDVSDLEKELIETIRFGP